MGHCVSADPFRPRIAMGLHGLLVFSLNHRGGDSACDIRIADLLPEEAEAGICPCNTNASQTYPEENITGEAYVLSHDELYLMLDTSTFRLRHHFRRTFRLPRNSPVGCWICVTLRRCGRTVVVYH